MKKTLSISLNTINPANGQPLEIKNSQLITMYLQKDELLEVMKKDINMLCVALGCYVRTGVQVGLTEQDVMRFVIEGFFSGIHQRIRNVMDVTYEESREKKKVCIHKPRETLQNSQLKVSFVMDVLTILVALIELCESYCSHSGETVEMLKIKCREKIEHEYAIADAHSIVSLTPERIKYESSY